MREEAAQTMALSVDTESAPPQPFAAWIREEHPTSAHASHIALQRLQMHKCRYARGQSQWRRESLELQEQASLLLESRRLLAECNVKAAWEGLGGPPAASAPSPRSCSACCKPVRKEDSGCTRSFYESSHTQHAQHVAPHIGAQAAAGGSCSGCPASGHCTGTAMHFKAQQTKARSSQSRFVLWALF